MNESLFKEIKDTLSDRGEWERKQSSWFTMRYTGIKRAAPPYKNAPDMHYPLVDTMIDKLKPYYIAQIYNQERLATFISGKPQQAADTVLAERFFDYTLKQNTNFERTVNTAIDFMLMYGRGPIKVMWDTANSCIRFVAVRPIYIIVPSYPEDLQKADWLVHVIHLSQRQYEANKQYKQGTDFISKIKGRGSETYQNAADEIRLREGIMVGENDEQIVLWEVYTREGGQIKIETMSPMAGEYGEKVKDTGGLPYNHKELPFCDLRYELADPDYYGTRGITEILSHFELDLCKLWNHKLQFLDFHGQPTYKNTGIIPNPANFQNRPGKILPQGIEPTQTVQAPIEFKEEMQLQRAIAEDRVQVPDLTAGEHLSGSKGSKGEITATQINAIVGQAGQGNDMRGRTFRGQLGVIFKQSQSLIDQYMAKDKWVLEDFTEVPQAARHSNYKLMPTGSADSYNKEQRVQRAMGYKQVFTGDPSIEQGELSKYVLEQDDPALVKRLWRPSQDQQLSQAQLQAEEILLMNFGFPAKTREDDMDAVHIQTLAQYVEMKLHKGEAIEAGEASLEEQHFQAHVQQMGAKKDKQGMLMLKSPQVQAAMATLHQLASTPGGSGDQGQGAAPPAAPQTPPEPPPQSSPSQIMDSVANLIKAGVKMNVNDVNAALVKAGLPPLATDIDEKAVIKPVPKAPAKKAA